MEVNRIGPTIVYEPDSHKAHDLDIVLVHGLFGHPKKTWSLNLPKDASGAELAPGDIPSETGDESETERQPRKKRRTRGRELFQDVFWPRDFLPTVFPQARIVTWGYDVQIEQFLNATSQASLFHHAENFLSDLVMLRNSDTGKPRPLLFIAHSLGGIVVKDALSLSGNEKTVVDQILPATIGVMFLGTPHHGSNAASLGKIVFELSKFFFKKPNLQILRGLETNSEILERISRNFGQVLSSGRIRVHSFREELPTNGVMVVSSASSTIGYFDETRGSLHANHRNMAKFSSIRDVKFQRVVSVLQDWVKETRGQLFIQKSSQAANKEFALPDGLIFDKELQRCLKSLYSLEAHSRFEDIKPTYQETYNWLFDHQVGFEDWLAGKNSENIYWIQGKPGSGKSTVMKFAMKHHLTRELLSKYNDNFWVIAGFFFHDRGATVQKSVKGFLRQILYQVIHQRKQLFILIYSVFSTILERSNDSPEALADGWSLSTLHEALTLIGRKSTYEVNICLFIDALDEHDGDHRELVLILKSIARLTDNPLFRTRLVLAGRPENVFKTAFQCCPGFSIHDYTTADIRHYAEGRIQADMRGNLAVEGEEELRNLVESIVQKAQGVFLWVRLVVSEIVEGLCEGDTMEELKTLLSTIPTELGELYTRALRRSSRTSLQALIGNKKEAYVMFQIASCALEPFLLHDFLASTLFLTTGKDGYLELERLSGCQMERRLNSRSAGLLEVTKNGMGPVQFIHQTVKEFMITGTGGSVIHEGLSEERLESGFGLIFRFILKLFDCFTSRALDIRAQRFVIKNFADYAYVLEWHEERCVASSFEPTTLRLSEQLQHDILTQILDTLNKSQFQYYETDALNNIKNTNTLNSMRQHDGTKFCIFYLICNLPLSLKKSLSIHKSSMNREEYWTLLQAATSVKHHPRGLARVLQILTEEGIIECLLEDESQYLNVNDCLSQLREELPESEYISISSKPTREEAVSGM